MHSLYAGFQQGPRQQAAHEAPFMQNYTRARWSARILCIDTCICCTAAHVAVHMTCAAVPLQSAPQLQCECQCAVFAASLVRPYPLPWILHAAIRSVRHHLWHVLLLDFLQQPSLLNLPTNLQHSWQLLPACMACINTTSGSFLAQQPSTALQCLVLAVIQPWKFTALQVPGAPSFSIKSIAGNGHVSATGDNSSSLARQFKTCHGVEMLLLFGFCLTCTCCCVV